MAILKVSSDRVLHSPEDSLSPGTIEFDSTTGLITAIRHSKDIDADFQYGTAVIMPGLVDAHVHLNEPGRTDWEGFESGTRAAISGGVTTVVDMPLNAIPPTTTVENLGIKLKAAKGKCYSDVAFWGGVIPTNTADLIPLVHAGVRGFKCFLINSGIEEFPHVSPSDVALAMKTLENSGSLLMFHAELDKHEAVLQATSTTTKDATYQDFLDSRPDSFEVDAITKVIEIARKHPALRIHIVHLASAEALPILRAAQRDGLRISVETCFHYLTFDAHEIPEHGTQYKCCPPIRSNKNREALWEALREGIITSVVSDHSPCTPKLKQGDFLSAWGGVSALGLGLQILWTEGAKRGFTIQDLSRWTSRNTAIQTSLWSKKGSLSVGKHADFLVWHPEEEWTVTMDDLHFKNKISPYLGRRLKGRIQETWLRGNKVWDVCGQWRGARGETILKSSQGVDEALQSLGKHHCIFF